MNRELFRALFWIGYLILFVAAVIAGVYFLPVQFP